MDAEGPVYQPVGVPDGVRFGPETPYSQVFVANVSGQLHGVLLPHTSNPGETEADLLLTLFEGADESRVLARSTLTVPPSSERARGIEVSAGWEGAELLAGATYTLRLETNSVQNLEIYRTTIAGENWDEHLPVPFLGYNPGGLYREITLENRWYDDENKRQMIYQVLQETDYVILPSQRGIWSVSRLQLTYPMTIEYYRALFEGGLGFDLAASFSSPIRLGPLWFSDVGGGLAWKQPPELPLFNFSLLAAEEAFSVYDHPPVWIFAKGADFEVDSVAQLLGNFDLSGVIVQSPRDARPAPIE
jgi:hypothetical protein